MDDDNMAISTHASWDIGTLAGVRVRVHPTFAILVAWVALSHLLLGRGLQSAAEGVLFLLVVFGIVVLHELGHALVARRFGIVTRDITLLPIGGVSSLERIPEKPWQELAVALAGPAVNVALALVCLAVVLLAGLPVVPDSVSLVGVAFATKLLWVNVSLAAFNLVPAFPMDGGRVLRALLAMKMPRARATQIAAWIGRALAVGFAVVGVFANPLLLLIAWFVWVGAGHEALAERTRTVPAPAMLTRDEPFA